MKGGKRYMLGKIFFWSAETDAFYNFFVPSLRESDRKIQIITR